MINLVDSFLKINKISNVKVIVAVSGGPDSMALLYILNLLKEKHNLILEVAYVNHGIRSIEENLKDYNLINSFCITNSIKLNKKDICTGKIEDLAKKSKSSTEAIARDIRYSFFKTLSDNNGFIAVGHNLDDQVETQIMRFFQGSSYNGLLGIKNKRDNIIRPLLSIEKSEILNFLKDNSISYFLDKTNNELDYLRNKVRNTLIPVIKDVFPSYKNGLQSFNKNLNDIKHLITINSKSLNWEVFEDIHSVNYLDFIELSVLERQEEIFEIFNKTYIGGIKSYRLPKRFLKPLEKVSFNNNEIVLEGHGFRLTRKKDKLLWSYHHKS